MKKITPGAPAAAGDGASRRDDSERRLPQRRSDPTSAEFAEIQKAYAEARQEICAAGSGLGMSGDFPVFARLYFRKLTEDLNHVCRKADLNDPDEFHSLLWMLSRLGDVSNEQIAVDVGVSPTQVSRWVKQRITPDRMPRRIAIISSALRHFNANLLGAPPTPLRTTQRRARVADDAHSEVLRCQHDVQRTACDNDR